MWGTIPDWITAMAAVAALGAAVWAGLTSKHLVGVEMKRGKKSREREIRTQASAISAWLVGNTEDSSTSFFGILLHNSSSAPVFEVRVDTCDFSGQPLKPLTLVVLPPGDYLVRQRNSGWGLPEDTVPLAGQFRPIARSDKWLVRQIVFTDSYGACWRRGKTAILEPEPLRP